MAIMAPLARKPKTCQKYIDIGGGFYIEVVLSVKISRDFVCEFANKGGMR